MRPLEFANISKLVGGDIAQKVCNRRRETDSGQWQRRCHIDTAESEQTKGSFQLNTSRQLECRREVWSEERGHYLIVPLK